MSSPVLSDAFRAHPLNLNHKIIDLSSIEILPDSHAWTFEANKHSSSCESHIPNLESIPIIDLNDKNNWGVFQAVNHNVPKNLVEEVELAGERLFSLPMHRKLMVERTSNGLSGYGVVRISSFFQKSMWCEGFTIVGSPREHALKSWPHDYHNFCDTIEEYQKEMKNLASHLMRLMLESLGVTERKIQIGPWAWLHTQTPLSLTFSIKATPVACRCSEETVLGGSRCSPTPEPLVVMIGDLMHILSNGAYLNPLHRAVVNQTRQRFSIVYLHGPPSNVKIGLLQQLVDNDHPPLYRPITWSEYLGIKAQHFDKALTTISLRNGFMEGDDDDSVKID
ncbi:UNVERIFIED_CONTAM: Gibberellin 3-beta-dioxygenase 1 [Sesamum indicum]